MFLIHSFKSLLQKETFVVYGSGFIVFFLGYTYFNLVGYPLVVTATKTLSLTTPPIYMILILFPFGILVGEGLWTWKENKTDLFSTLLLIELCLLALISILRLLYKIPISGHGTILGFFLLHYVISLKCSKPFRILLGGVALIITLYFKFFLWNDPTTLLFGILLGIVCWIPEYFYQTNYEK